MELIVFMLKKIILLNTEHFFKESHILKNIKARDIIKAEKIIIL